MTTLDSGIYMATRPNWKQKPGRPKERLGKIIETLEEAPGTFEEICKRVKLARTTLSEGLTELENQARIERTVEPPKERGRGKKHRAVISLSGKEMDPVIRALRHLEKVTTVPLIDIERGKELLTDDVVNAILVISTLYPEKGETPNTPECPHPASWKCHKDEEVGLKEVGIVFKLELDEYHLLKALARYDRERFRAGCVEHTGDASDLLKIGLQEWLEREAEVVMKKVSNPETFPMLSVVRKRGVVEKFDALLEWISPLVDLHSEEVFMKKPNGQYVIKWIVPPPSEGMRTGGIMSAIAVNGKISIYILHDGVRLRCGINEDNLETEMDQLSKVLVRTDVDKEGSYELNLKLYKPREATDLALIKATTPPDMKLPKPNNLAEAVFYNEGNEYFKILRSVKGMLSHRAKMASYTPRLLSWLNRYKEKEKKKD